MTFPPLSVPRQHSRYTRLCLLTLLALAIAACGSIGTQTPSTQTQPQSLAAITADINAAQRLRSPEKERRLMQYAEALYTIDQQQQARALIENIDTEVLTDADYIHYVAIANTLYTAQHAFIENYHLLSSDRSERLWSSLSLSQQQQLGQRKAELYGLFGLSEQSVLTLMLVDEILLDPLDITENRERIWQQLMTFPLEQLKLKLTQTDEPTLRGWYQLAQLSKVFVGNIQAQSTALAQWQAENPSHPANKELPLDLQLLQTLLQERPQKIALLLPLQGDFAAAGKAIRDGFFAAYFTNQDILHKVSVDLFDTSDKAISEVYTQAVAQGANLIIGPLRKEKVAELQQQPRTVTTLALNYLDDNRPDDNRLDDDKDHGAQWQKPLFQFGLSLEDEAKQAADRAWLEGHRHAMILSTHSSWSQRAADAFRQQWQRLGGRVVATHDFSDDSNYSDIIKNALHIDQSHARAQSLKRLFGRQMEFEPRRRKDIDMIFLVARSRESQQIKPTLAFHYAGDIPVYATSQIYSSVQSADKNRDLNGIRFVTLPWVIAANNTEKRLIDTHIKAPANYERLYAMGTDVFLLHDKLSVFQHAADRVIYGNTGKLYLDGKRRIAREQPWAEIIKGEAQALPQLKTDDVILDKDAPTASDKRL
ncbi:MAG: penicillin-binding protein activator [Cellvibrionaceae bacterium]|nr:penicillin-binding protein activator [Cellvibrionaceae bacterium]